MTPGARQQLVYSETNNPQAYALVLKGRFYGSKGGTEDRLKAADYFQQAIAIDPKYAEAYAELSLCYNGLVNNQFLDQREYIPKAEAAARTALELNERCAECHRAMAVARVNAGIGKLPNKNSSVPLN
jgi:tetratricopeptide (TPR) repeat protein